MKHIFYLAILILIYNQNDCNAAKNKEFIYKFKNTVTASNTASDKVLSQWSYSGNLIIQEYQDHKIFKLEDVKSSIFNGIRINEAEGIEKNISDEKNILTEPFGVYSKSLTDANISVLPNEDFWSINMKKSIASSFHVDTSMNNDKQDIERFIFGRCNVNFKVIKSGSTKIIEKFINHRHCIDEEPINERKNVKFMPTKNNYTPFQCETKRIYVVSKNNCLFSIDSTSNITIQISHDVRSNNKLEQTQYFELVTSSENTKPFDITKNTKYTNLIYEEFVPKSGKTQEIYLEHFANAYTNYKSEINQIPAQHWNVSIRPPVTDMIRNLKKFDSNCLRKLLVGILMSRDSHYLETFFEILPYVGTKHSVNLIRDIVKDEIDLHIKIKLLTTFPEYVNDINEETLQYFEEFLTYNYDRTQLKHTAVLSFASLLSKAIERNSVDSKITEKYVKQFYEDFLNLKKHEDKMIYLLGLVNVSNKLPLNAILNIIYNRNESRHIRALAIYGFKHRLTKYGTEVFTKFWPLVKNKNENFEIRVASLDLLLSCEISENQFTEIINYYGTEQNEPSEEHLANYIVTTVISLQNITGFPHYLGDWATTKYQQGIIHQNTRVWTTGNYRIGFTDKNSNFGMALQTRLVADPITNAINVIQLTFDQFAMSMILGDYHVYFKLEGVIDMMFIKAYLDERSNSDNPIMDLINLIQQCKYQLKDQEDFFIDFVVFSDNRALFAIHMDQDTFDKYIQSSFLDTFSKLITNYKSLSYPIIFELKVASDLGTEIEIAYDMHRVVQKELRNFPDLFKKDSIVNIAINNKIISHLTESIKSINPILDTKINIEKLHYDHKMLKLPIKIDRSNHMIGWENKNDAFSWVVNNAIYTYVNNITILKEHCANCNQVEEIPAGEAAAECIESEKYLNQCKMDTSIWREKLSIINSLGIIINNTGTKESEEMELLRRMKPYGHSELTEVVNSHQGNAILFPFAKPILYFLHLKSHRYYLENDLHKHSVRTSSSFNEPYTTQLKFTFNDESTINNNDPIDTFKFNCTFEIINQRIRDNKKLSGIRTVLRLGNHAENNDNLNKKQVENYFEIIADIDNHNNKKKMCLKHKKYYPNLSSDKFSLKPIKPAKGITTISWDEVEEFIDICPHYFIKLTDFQTVSDEHNQIIQNTDDYKTCIFESVGFKYTPPTQSCIAAHKEVSLYRDYVVYLEMYHRGMPENAKKNKIFEYHHVGYKTINVTIARGVLREIDPKPEILNYVEPSTFVDSLSGANDDIGVNFGLEEMCTILPTNSISFNGKIKNIFDTTDSKDVIALVECTNSTQIGLTVTKIDKYTIIFKYWSDKNILSTKIENNQLKVILNGNEINKNTQNDNLKIGFIENDLFYVVNDLVELYCSPSSISIKINSFYSKYLCGECLN